MSATWSFSMRYANSRTTADRIRKYYRRESTIIEPPIRVREFAGGDGESKNQDFKVR